MSEGITDQSDKTEARRSWRAFCWRWYGHELIYPQVNVECTERCSPEGLRYYRKIKCRIDVMKRRFFGDLLLKGFIQGFSIVVLILGILGSAMAFLFGKSLNSLPGEWVWFFGVWFLTIIVSLFRAAWLMYQESLSVQMPAKVIRGMIPHDLYSEALAMIITEPDERLTHDALVSIYLVDQDTEKLLAAGQVVNIQGDKKVQIIITTYLTRNLDEATEDDLSKIKNNNSDILKNIVVKTSMTKRLLEVVANAG